MSSVPAKRPRHPKHAPDSKGGQFAPGEQANEPQISQHDMIALANVASLSKGSPQDDLLTVAENQYNCWWQIIAPDTDQRKEASHKRQLYEAQEAVQQRKPRTKAQEDALQIQAAWEDEQEIMRLRKNNRNPAWLEAELEMKKALQRLEHCLAHTTNKPGQHQVDRLKAVTESVSKAEKGLALVNNLQETIGVHDLRIYSAVHERAEEAGVEITKHGRLTYHKVREALSSLEFS